MLAAWMKATTAFWGLLSKSWQSALAASQAAPPSQEIGRSRPQELWDSMLKTWQTMLSIGSEPETIDSALKGLNALPEIAMRMAKTGWDGYFHLQQQWLAGVSRLGEQVEAHEFEHLDQDAFKAWLEIYEKDFRQLFTIPQLGLTRVYQERVNQALDKFNQFQLVAARFLFLLYLPVEKSLRAMGERLEQLSKESCLPDDFKEYYNVWIKTLEGHYMTLFKAPEYTQALSKALNATQDFITARDELLTDVLKTLPLPTNKDIDELYKELYLLKKKVKELTKKADKK